MGWNVERYGEIQQKHQFLYGNDLVKRLSEFMDISSKTILDIGCGEGTLTDTLATYAGKNGTIIGIDKDTGMIHRAASKYTHILFINDDVIEWLKKFYGKVDVIFSNAMLHWLKSYEALTSFFELCKPILSESGYGACHFSLQDNALTAKQFLQEHLRKYFQDDSITLSSSEYDYENVKKIIESKFVVVYQDLIYKSPFTDDMALNFDWMIKSQPIAHYFKSKDDLSKFIKYFRQKRKETPVKVVSSQCEFIFKNKKTNNHKTV